MSTRRVLIGAAVAALLAAAPAPGQTIVPAAPAEATATGVLTAPPGQSAALPPGTVTSPWCGGGPAGGGCCGPVGGNGPLTYELYSFTGPSLVVGGSELAARINTGWAVGGGFHTLLFNQIGDKAWVLDLGLSYTYNRGQGEKRPFLVGTPRAPETDAGGGITQRFPDELNPFTVRGLHRTTFNFGVGRDWWLRGPGLVVSEPGRNVRVGADIGGRYGTSHVDLVPTANTANYLRKANVIHGIHMGVHANWEVPLGSWIFFSGVNTEWDYTFTNLVPPQGADIHSVNIFLTAGVRY